MQIKVFFVKASTVVFEERKLNMMRGNEEVAQQSIKYSVVEVKILPSDSDIEKFKTHPDMEEEERLLYHLALQTDLAEDTGEDLTELILDESRKGRMEMKSEIRALENESRKERMEMQSEMRKLETLITQGDYQSRHTDDYKWMFLCSCVFVAFSAVISIAAFVELEKRS